MAFDRSEVKYWVGFASVPGVGRARITLLEQQFGSLGRAWQAPLEALRRTPLDRRTLDAIEKRRNSVDLSAEMEKLARYDIKAFTWHDPEYPDLLREVVDLPPVLYIRGELLPEDRTALAVVGTRKASAYGREAARHIVTGLARSGVTTVSGLAYGIDTVAHRSALEAGGRTIAVLASGLDMVYPAANAGLAREIVQRGALISEYAPGIKPEASHFPRRNRIMSGISLGVLIVEAREESGAHLTVNFALEQNRDVFAVPGSIFAPGSRGPHRWIQEGAKLVTQPEEILEELNLAVLGQQMELLPTVQATPGERRVLQHLSQEPVHIDMIGRLSGLPIAEVSSTLAMMELKGMVRQTGGMQYVLGR